MNTKRRPILHRRRRMVRVALATSSGYATAHVSRHISADSLRVLTALAEAAFRQLGPEPPHA